MYEILGGLLILLFAVGEVFNLEAPSGKFFEAKHITCALIIEVVLLTIDNHFVPIFHFHGGKPAVVRGTGNKLRP